MNKFQIGFTNFMNIALKIIVLIIVLVSFGNTIYFLNKGNEEWKLIILFFIISIGIFYYMFKKRVSQNKLLIGIILYALIIRIIWISTVKTVPFSDFHVILDAGKDVLQGNFHMFKGSAYFARFPHLTIIVLYFSLIRALFPDPILAIKILNVIFSTVNVFLCYLIVKDLFNNKEKGLIGAFIAAIYPSIIIYSSVNCGENMAIPFYLLSVYLFIIAMKRKKYLTFLTLSAISLSIGNLFRMVAMVMVIAYVMYILIYFNKTFVIKLKAILSILAGFFIPLILISFTLKAANITEFNLWKGSESAWTSILKGSNLETYGRFTAEDAAIPEQYDYDYDKVEKASKEIVKERLSSMSLPEFMKFYIVKYVSQWKDGDCGGVFWATDTLSNTNKDATIDFANGVKVCSNILYTVLLIFTFVGLFNKNQYKNNSIINLLYIIFGGFVLFYLITEQQERYAYIINWLFIILPLTALKSVNDVPIKEAIS